MVLANAMVLSLWCALTFVQGEKAVNMTAPENTVEQRAQDVCKESGCLEHGFRFDCSAKEESWDEGSFLCSAKSGPSCDASPQCEEARKETIAKAVNQSGFLRLSSLVHREIRLAGKLTYCTAREMHNGFTCNACFDTERLGTVTQRKRMRYLQCHRAHNVSTTGYLAGTNWDKQYFTVTVEITKETECFNIAGQLMCDVRKVQGRTNAVCHKGSRLGDDQDASAHQALVSQQKLPAQAQAQNCLPTIQKYLGVMKWVTNGFGTAERGTECRWGTSILKCLPGNKVELKSGHVRPEGGIADHPPAWKCQTSGLTWGFRSKGGWDYANEYGPYGTDGYASNFATNGTKGWCFTQDGKWGGVMLDPVAVQTFESIKGTELSLLMLID